METALCIVSAISIVGIIAVACLAVWRAGRPVDEKMLYLMDAMIARMAGGKPRGRILAQWRVPPAHQADDRPEPGPDNPEADVSPTPEEDPEDDEATVGNF